MNIDLSKPATQTEFGDLVGITQQAVSDQVNSGILPRGVASGEWLLIYCGRLREQAAGRLGHDVDSPDLVRERALLAREQRKMAEMNVGERRGELISVAAVVQVFSKTVSDLRDVLLSLPHRTAPILAPESDPRKVFDLLDAEIRQALSDISGVPQKLQGMAEQGVSATRNRA